MVHGYINVCFPCFRVRTGPWKPGKCLNLKFWIPGLESPAIFVEVLESPGIWTYRSIFLIISLQEFSHYTSSEIWVYPCTLKVCEFIEKVLEFDIERSWKVLESEMSKCVWTVLFASVNWGKTQKVFNITLRYACYIHTLDVTLCYTCYRWCMESLPGWQWVV